MKKNILGKMGIAVCISAVLMTAGCAKKAENVPDTSAVKTETEAAAEAETKKAEAAVSEAKEADASDFRYEEEDGKIVLASYKGTATDIIIPSQIDGKDVYAIGERCFVNGDVVSVICPETLVEIRKNAFTNCWDMKKIELNNGLKAIGDFAFSSNGIEEIELPDTVESLGYAAFGANNLKSIKFSAALSEISIGCFTGSKFENIIIPDSVKIIDEQAFGGCKELKEVVFEEGVEVIGDDVFWDCTNLLSVTIPSTVTEIGAISHNDVPNVTVTVTAGSYAEQYMKDKGISYVTK